MHEDDGTREEMKDDGSNRDDPSEHLLSQLAVGGTRMASDLPCETAHDLVLLLYTLHDFGELEWPLI
jgi:hypothetical protein